jgi:hypothetical protein
MGGFWKGETRWLSPDILLGLLRYDIDVVCVSKERERELDRKAKTNYAADCRGVQT